MNFQRNIKSFERCTIEGYGSFEMIFEECGHSIIFGDGTAFEKTLTDKARALIPIRQVVPFFPPCPICFINEIAEEKIK